MLEQPQDLLAPGFLDCGAHSVHTGALEFLPMEEYIQWTSKYHQHFRIVAAPDDIGDSEQTKKNTLEYAQRTEGIVPRKKLLPIYHLEARDVVRGYPMMLEYADKLGCEWVAIGGALGRDRYGRRMNADQKLICLEEIFRRFPRDRFKIHLLGITEPSIVRRFRPDSVDSSRFIQEGAALWVSRYNDDFTDRVRYRVNNKSSDEIYKIAAEELWRIKHVLPGEFDGPAEIERHLHSVNESSLFVLVNGLNVVAFEEHIRETVNPGFRHYMTCSAGLGGSESFVDKCHVKIWEHRALVSYAQFHGRSSISYQHELMLFRSQE